MPKPRSILAAAFIAVLLAGVSARASAQSYPRLGLYGSMFGDGYPLWDVNGVVDNTVLDQISRFDTVVLDASPITPYRPDVALALRARHPSIRLLAYVTGHSNWYAAQPDSDVHFPTRYWRLIRDLDGFLYNTQGGQYGTISSQAGNINLAKRDASGHYVVAEGIANLFYDAIVRTGIWDGLFVDNYCDNMLWMEASGESVDVVRAGYPNRTAFAAAWKAASDTLAARLRLLSGPTEILVGNCAAGTKYAWFNGWMRENFPYQGGGTWYTNMYNDPGGYFVDETRWLTPRDHFIYSASSGLNTPYTADNMRKARFGLGSASLGSGFASIGNAQRSTRAEQFMAWWYDEYAVDLGTGMASTRLQDTGWLGLPLGEPYQMAWIGATPDASTNPDFESDVTSGWDFSSSIGSVLSRDTTTAASGSACARLTVPSTQPGVPWATAFSTRSSIPVTLNGQYSATFWAKASRPRTIEVHASWAGGGGSFAAQLLSLETTWKRYQVVLRPNGSGNATLAFFLAGDTGDVLFDDVHFQSGVFNVYRRDFQNGIVLVNPGPTAQDVVLEAPARRITGLRDASVNNGLYSATQRVGASDALFLIGNDVVPPAAIRDLHPVDPAAPGAVHAGDEP